FISALLTDILQGDRPPPELEAVYRVGKSTPAAEQRPLPIIIRFARCRQRNQVLALAKERGQLFYQDRKIYLFPDMSRSLAMKRAAFKEVKSKLYKEGIKFSLRFPAMLLVTTEDMEYKFYTPAEVEKFTEDLAK
ncbi:LINE-1 type transposase domain-containing protein 1, partial [Xyrichtys novacula]